MKFLLFVYIYIYKINTFINICLYRFFIWGLANLHAMEGFRLNQFIRHFLIILIFLGFITDQSVLYADSEVTHRRKHHHLAQEAPLATVDSEVSTTEGGKSLLDSTIISSASSEENTSQSAQKVTMSLDQLISIDYHNANLSDVLKAIAYSFNVNMVLTKDISGKVSANLKDLTLEDALNAILNVNNYAFMRKGNIVYIMPIADMQPLTESIPLNYLAAKDAKGLVSKSVAKGSVEANEDTNSLIVQGTPAEIENIKEVIKIVDVPPVQVLIEVKIVDINKADEQKIDNAVSLLYSAGKTGALFTKYSPGGNSSTDRNGAVAPLDAVGGDQGAFSVAHRSKDLLSQFSINALITQHKARVLASPSISTLNGREASITIGEKRAYTSSSNANAAGLQSTTAFVDVGIKLKVLPIVSPDGWITMKVHPEVSTFLGAIGGTPDISTREADATVRVKDNQTIVIGGLISKSDIRDNDGIPYVKDIPFLGKLFEGHNTKNDNTELVVFITPHIIPMPDQNLIAEHHSIDSLYTQDVDMLLGILNYADSLEQDKSKDYAKSLYLTSEQIKAYRMVLQQFPQSGKSDYCLYKIAFLYAKEFGKCDAAKEAFMELKSTNTESPYLNVTEALVNACEVVSASKKD